MKISRMRHRSVRGINLLIFNEWFEKVKCLKMKSAMRTVNDERCRRYFIYALWLHNSQNNATPNKNEETVPVMEWMSHETYTGSTKLTAFLSERSLLCIERVDSGCCWWWGQVPAAARAFTSVLVHVLLLPHMKCEMLTLHPCLQTWTSPSSCSHLWLSNNVDGGTDVNTYVQTFVAQIRACKGKLKQCPRSWSPQGFLLPGTALSPSV